MSQDHSNVDKFARIMALIGILVSLVAIYVPYHQAESDKVESLNIQLNIDDSSKIKIIRNDLPAGVVQLPWFITFSNTGSVKLSIVSYRVSQLSVANTKTTFTGLDGGLEELSGAVKTLPITIDAGESLTFKISLGLMIRAQVANSLRDFYQEKGLFNLSEASDYLANKSNLTIYGSNTAKLNSNYEIVSNSDSQKKDKPIYDLIFTTGRGKEFVVRNVNN